LGWAHLNEMERAVCNRRSELSHASGFGHALRIGDNPRSGSATDEMRPSRFVGLVFYGKGK
jgi:hypothetical protein